jgi:hypothetical protein
MHIWSGEKLILLASDVANVSDQTDSALNEQMLLGTSHYAVLCISFWPFLKLQMSPKLSEPITLMQALTAST